MRPLIGSQAQSKESLGSDAAKVGGLPGGRGLGREAWEEATAMVQVRGDKPRVGLERRDWQLHLPPKPKSNPVPTQAPGPSVTACLVIPVL